MRAGRHQGLPSLDRILTRLGSGLVDLDSALRGDLTSLTRAARDRALLVKRYVKLGQDLGLLPLGIGCAHVVLIKQPAAKLGPRQEFAFDGAHIRLGGAFGKLAGNHIGVIVQRDGHQVLQLSGQTGCRLWLGELSRIIPHDPLKDCTARAEIAGRGNPVGRRPCKTAFRLSDVGARDLSDLEAIARSFELTLQDLLIVDVQLEDRLISPHIDIGNRRVEEHALLLRFQARSLGQHLQLRGIGRRDGSPTAIKGLREIEFAAAWLRSPLVAEEIALRISVLGADRPIHRQLGAPVAERLRDALVDGA